MADSTVSGVSEFIQAMNASATNRKDDENLSMDDFLQLMVAQLQNQDMFSPTDSTQFVSQMAQFSMVNALMNMQELSSVTYSMSLIGKQATVAFMTDTGEMKSLTGIVEGVNLFNGEAEVVIDGEAYGMANVMSVVDASVGKSGNENLAANAGLIGMFATAMRSTDTGVELTKGLIEQLRFADDEVWAYIGDRYFALRELTELSTAQDAADANDNP